MDWISDIGGMQGMLISGAALILAIWNHNHLENYLVSKLYRLSSTPFEGDHLGANRHG